MNDPYVTIFWPDKTPAEVEKMKKDLQRFIRKTIKTRRK